MAGKTIEVDSSNFSTEVLNSSVPVLVDFWATWCGPCKMIAPILEEAAQDFEGRATIAKLNVDQARDLAIQYGIKSIPALLLFQNGEVVDRKIGALNKDQLSQFLNQFV